MRILKVLKIKYRRENTSASFSDKPALPLVVLMKRFVCFLIACEIWLSKTNISYIFEFC